MSIMAMHKIVMFWRWCARKSAFCPCNWGGCVVYFVLWLMVARHESNKYAQKR